MTLHTTTWDPAIAARGDRVAAVDLPGHGESRADPTATLAPCIQQLVAACRSAELAIGHSPGGLVLAGAAGRLGVPRTRASPSAASRAPATRSGTATTTPS